MKKRTKIIIISITVIILFIFAIVYVKMVPMLRIKNAVDEIKNAEYSYVIDAKVEKSLLNIISDEYQFSLQGQKSSDVAYGEFVYDDNEVLDIYIDKNSEVIFDLTPVFNLVFDKAEGTLGISVNLIRKALKQITVSLSQLEEITGKEIDISGGTKIDYKISQEKKLDSSEKVWGDDAYYYRMTFDDNDILIAVPKKSKVKEIYIKAVSDKFEGDFTINYELCDVENIEMPKPNLPDSMVSTMKSLYQYIVK